MADTQTGGDAKGVMEMMVPTIHMNGTAQETLREQVCDACTALRTAEDALKGATPNQRDYYPQSGAAWSLALGEHGDRMYRLHSVLTELERLAEAIADGGYQGG